MKLPVRPLLLAAALLGQTIQAQKLPYQDPTLSSEERAADLCSRLTLEEKAALMMNTSPAIERLGIPAFDWWSEALHGVGRNGVATVFPSCIGMACSFDNDLLHQIYTAVSDEARAKNTRARRDGTVGKYSSLSFWTPNINIFRDPRWGRGQETYGEDPFMNAMMGAEVVDGLQGGKDNKYYKLHACAKHYAVHSGPEKTRHSFDITDLPARDLYETYLPAFRYLVKDAGVQQVMCAYQRFEGAPCCGSDRLLHQILRDDWGFDGMVVSDCGAIGDFYRKGRHEVSKDAQSAAALGVLSGTDVECGSVYRNLPEAVRRGDISEADIDVSVRRLLKGRFDLGDLDPDSIVEWTRIPESVIASPGHKALARKMAQEQMVLLKNDGVLPLKKSDAGRILVMGPNAADSVMLWGIYYGQPSHSVTVLEGITEKVGPVAYAKGCEITALTETESILGKMKGAGGSAGMTARYWNNTDMAGDPVATAAFTSPVALDNGGNTVFAPGVNLTDFTLSARGTYTAEADETLDITFNNDDGGRIIVNGDTIHNRWKVDPYNIRTFRLPVEKGKTYDIQVDYMQLAGDATFGLDVARNRAVTAADAVKRAEDYDIVVFVGGIHPNLEREEARVTEPGFDNGDRSSIELPQAQRDILAALHEAGKKVVLVNCSGSAVALTPETRTCDAILQAWYPGEQGGHAVADVLFGDYNPSGKLAVTFYKDDAQLPPFDEYRMAGRTYRYFYDEPLYPFGHGLSYTTFAYANPEWTGEAVEVDVTNTGAADGTEIVQLYLRRPADEAGPIKTLRGYERVDLKAGETRRVTIPMPRERFETWDEATSTMRVVPGEHQLMVGSSSRAADLLTLPVVI